MSASDISEQKLLKLLGASKIIAGSSDIGEAVKSFSEAVLDSFYFSGIFFRIYSKEKEEISYISYYSGGINIPEESLHQKTSLFGNENAMIQDLPFKTAFIEYKDLPGFLKKTFEKYPFKGYMPKDASNTYDVRPYYTYAFNIGDSGDIIILHFLAKEHSFNLNIQKSDAILSLVQTLKSAFIRSSMIKNLESRLSALKENNLEKELQLTSYKDMLDTYENILTVSSHELVEAQSTIKAMQVVEEMSRRELLDVKQSMDSYKEILSDKKKKRKESTSENIKNALTKWVLNIKQKKYKDKRFLTGSALLLTTFIMIIILISHIFSFLNILSKSPDTAYLFARTGKAKVSINFLKSREESLKDDNFLNNILKNRLFDLKALPETENIDNAGRASENSDGNLTDVENQSIGPVTISLTLKGVGQIPNGWSVILSVNSDDALLKIGEIFKGYTLIKIDNKKGFAIVKKEGKTYKLFVNKTIKVTR
jgi:hypothetical protein